MTIRVLVADDQSMVRAGFRMLLADEQDIEVVAEAENGREAVEMTKSESPDLVLSDWNMPEMSGIEALRQLRAAGNDLDHVGRVDGGADRLVFDPRHQIFAAYVSAYRSVIPAT